MNTTKNCQNCKEPFVLEQEDFSFYEKMNVPAPTFCFDCRVQRRMAFRNERVLYRRKCDFPGHNEELISIFSAENKQCVYDHAAWWGDGWDSLSYATEIDWKVPFISQIKELWSKVPDVALLNINPVNSEYCSITEGNKNCYLVFGGDFNEDTLYSTYVFHDKNCLDNYWTLKSESLYEAVDSFSCNNLIYARYCENSYNSAFLFNCRNCHDCFGCANLVNGAYQIFNVQYSKEEYFEKIKEFDLSSRQAVRKIKEDFAAHILKYPRRFSKMLRCVNSSGDNLENCKNCFHCFDILESGENCRHLFLSYSSVKDSMDSDRVGLSTELCYDTSTAYPGSRIVFSRFIFSSHDISYSYNCHNSSNLFGCVGMRNKQYCILNKQYSKEEYEEIVPKLIEHMNALPYVDAAGRRYPYGEFFPIEISPFAYNETIAAEMFPVSEKEASSSGYSWRDPDDKKHQTTKKFGDLPDNIKDAQDSIVNEAIECEHWTEMAGECNEQCTKAFRIVPAELQFYRRFNIPLPTLCPSCRHFLRVKQRNPMKLFERKCDCNGADSLSGVYKNLSAHSHGSNACGKNFETTYAPDRPEIVYCEQCYQQEVV